MSDETFMTETPATVNADIHLVANQDEGEVHFWLIERDSRFELFVSGADGQGVRMCTFDHGLFDVAASTIIALMLSYPVGGSERGMAFLDTNFGVPTGPDLLIPDFNIVEASS